MTSDRVKKYIGINDQRSIKKGQYMTKKDRIEKIKDNQLKENIKNKCMVLGCNNAYDSTINLLCNFHQPKINKPIFKTINGNRIRIK
jgi:hypothetical protein